MMWLVPFVEEGGLRLRWSIRKPMRTAKMYTMYQNAPRTRGAQGAAQSQYAKMKHDILSLQ